MLVFWIAAAVLAAAVALVVLRRAARTDRLVESPEAVVYRRHLAEQDELRARGLLGEEEWRAARAEAARRLLGAADADEPPARPATARERKIVLGAIAATAVLGVGIYLAVGAPGAPDYPYAQRLKAWREADPATLDAPRAAAVLASIAGERPNDPEVWSNLGLARAQAGDSIGAVRAFERALALRPNFAEDWTALGVSLAELNGGKPGPDGLRAFERALAIDPEAPAPRFYLGQAAIVEGRTAEGLAMWRRAADALPADDPRRQAIEADIRRVESGRVPAPDAQAAQAVASASPEEQEQMIRGMVAGLAARLEQQPDDVQGWARLVRAYSVLGDTAAREAALKKAREVFKDRPGDLAAVEAAAR